MEKTRRVFISSVLMLFGAISASSSSFSHIPLYTNKWVKKSTLFPVLNLRGGDSEDSDVMNIQCLLEGKMYNLTAETVGDVLNNMHDQTGESRSNIQLSFRGSQLHETDSMLNEHGVCEADILTASLIYTSKPKKSESTTSTVHDNVLSNGLENVIDKAGLDKASLDKMLDGMGGKNQIEGIMKQMGLDGSMTPEKIEEQMKSLLSNPQVSEMFNNPILMEQSRQELIANPMMMQMFDSMGLGSVIRDPKAYLEHMSSVKGLLNNPEMFRSPPGGATETPPNTPNKSTPWIDDFDEGDL